MLPAMEKYQRWPPEISNDENRWLKKHQAACSDEWDFKIVQNRLNTELTIEGILLTMYDTRLRLSNQVVAEVQQHFDELVFETSVCWTCSNFQIPFRGEHTWCGFGSEGPVAMAFLKRLQHYIPLPAWAQEVDSKVEKAWLDDLEFPIPMDRN